MSFYEDMSLLELREERNSLLAECNLLNDLADEALAVDDIYEYSVYIDDAYDLDREIALIEERIAEEERLNAQALYWETLERVMKGVA